MKTKKRLTYKQTILLKVIKDNRNFANGKQALLDDVQSAAAANHGFVFRNSHSVAATLGTLMAANVVELNWVDGGDAGDNAFIEVIA